MKSIPANDNAEEMALEEFAEALADLVRMVAEDAYAWKPAAPRLVEVDG